MEKKQVSPYVNVGETRVDVRDVLRLMRVGQVFNTTDLLHLIEQHLLEQQIDENISEGVPVNFLAAMSFFAYVDWNTPYVNESEAPNQSGYVIRAIANPNELVMVARTTGPMKGRGGTPIIPRTVLDNGNYPESDGWSVVKEYAFDEG